MQAAFHWERSYPPEERVIVTSSLIFYDLSQSSLLVLEWPRDAHTVPFSNLF